MHYHTTKGGNMKINVHVSDKKEARDCHVRILTEYKKNVLRIRPGVPNADCGESGVIVVGDFSRNGICDAIIAALDKKSTRNAKNISVLVVEDIHRLRVESVENIIQISKEHMLETHLFGAGHNLNGAPYKVMDYLADRGFPPNPLEEFMVGQPVVKIPKPELTAVALYNQALNLEEKVKAALKNAKKAKQF
jgi:hypothetical protein